MDNSRSTPLCILANAIVSFGFTPNGTHFEPQRASADYSWVVTEFGLFGIMVEFQNGVAERKAIKRNGNDPPELNSI